MRFLVVVPTIRQGLPGFEATIAAQRASLTLPTDFHVLDGTCGKAQTLNRALNEIVAPSDCDVYVTMDDDFLPGQGWQDAIAAAFAALPDVGALGLWFGDGEEMRAYMRVDQNVLPLTEVAGLRIHRIRRGNNIPGAMLAFRKAVALAIGPTPEGGVRYQIYEDAFRCLRVQALGYGLAYVEADEPPRMLHYDDSEEYRRSKEAEINALRPHVASYLPTLPRRRDRYLEPLRRFVRRLRR